MTATPPFRPSRDFRLFWTARAASQFGDQISVLALPWLVAEITGSPMWVALIEVVAFTPVILVGLQLGAIADRRSRKRSMIEADLARVILVASIPVAAFLGTETTLGHVLLVAGLAGTLQILFEAASQAALPDMVPAVDVVAANARLGLTEGLASIGGPAVAGLFIATIGTHGAILIDALTFVVSAAAIALVVIPRERYHRTDESIRASVRGGLVAARSIPHIRALILAGGGVNIGAGMAIAMSAIYFQTTLALAGWQAGLIYAANGIGGIVGSAGCGRIVAAAGMGRSLLAGLTLTAVGVSLTGLMTAQTWHAVGIPASIAVGLGIAVAVIASASLRQHVVPGSVLGRVTATYRLAVNGAIAIGALLGGIVGTAIGVRAAILAAGSLMFVVIAAALASCLNGADPHPAATPAAASV